VLNLFTTFVHIVIRNEVPIKTVRNKGQEAPVSGVGYVALIKNAVNCLNKDEPVKIPNLFDAIRKKEIVAAVSNSLLNYKHGLQCSTISDR
jgi:hypothetical protein